jgi:hypothetical protein
VEHCYECRFQLLAWKSGGRFGQRIAANHSTLPCRYVGKALSPWAAMPLNMHEDTTREVQMHQSDALGIPQNEACGLALHSNRLHDNWQR